MPVFRSGESTSTHSSAEPMRSFVELAVDPHAGASGAVFEGSTRAFTATSPGATWRPWPPSMVIRPRRGDCGRKCWPNARAIARRWRGWGDSVCLLTPIVNIVARSARRRDPWAQLGADGAQKRHFGSSRPTTQLLFLQVFSEKVRRETQNPAHRRVAGVEAVRLRGRVISDAPRPGRV
jgi:hypothetical protein